MDTAFHFQDFEAPHGRALKISEPLMGAALNFANFLSATCSRPKNFRAAHGRSLEFSFFLERHMDAPKIFKAGTPFWGPRFWGT